MSTAVLPSHSSSPKPTVRTPILGSIEANRTPISELDLEHDHTLSSNLIPNANAMAATNNNSNTKALIHMAGDNADAGKNESGHMDNLHLEEESKATSNDLNANAPKSPSCTPPLHGDQATNNRANDTSPDQAADIITNTIVNNGPDETTANASRSTTQTMNENATATSTTMNAIIPYSGQSSSTTEPNLNAVDHAHEDIISDTNIPHKGIVNLGNTCYLNAGLQMLMSIEGFVDDLIAQYERDLRLRKLKSKPLSECVPAPADGDQDVVATSTTTLSKPTVVPPKPTTKYPLRDALAQFFLSMKQYERQNSAKGDSDYTSNSGEEAGATVAVLPAPTALDSPHDTPIETVTSTPTPLPSSTPSNESAIPSDSQSEPQMRAVNPMNLKKQIDKMTPQFVGFWQQDSHEFLSTLLDLLHDEIHEVENSSQNDAEGDAADGTSTTPTFATLKEPISGMILNKCMDTTTATSSSTANASGGAPGENFISAENAQRDYVEDETVLEDSTTMESDNTTMDVDVNDSSMPDPIVMSGSASVPSSSSIPEEDVGGEFVVIEKKDVPDPQTAAVSGPDYGASSKKKARVSSPKTIPKTSSFTDLNMEEIGTLLHGRNANDSKDEISAPPSAVSTTGCKLVGGRIASTSPPAICIERGDAIAELPNEDVMEGGEDQENAEGNATGLLNDIDENDTNDNEDTSAQSKQLWTDNIVDQWFTTAVRTHLKCDSCNFTRSHEEVYRYLSIEVGPAPDGDGVENAVASHERTIHENIRKFFRPDTRELTCEKCFCESATQSTEIIKLPRALIVHLKRFIVDVSEDYTSITYRKNQAAFEFGQNLTLQKNDHDGVLGDYLSADVSIPCARRKISTSDTIQTSDDTDEDSAQDFDLEVKSISGESFIDVSHFDPCEQKMYKIRSVVNHIGNSANCGHYTADAYKLYATDMEDELSSSKYAPDSQQPFGEKRKWTRFNDSFVSRIEENDAMGDKAQQTAYMITYELENIS